MKVLFVGATGYLGPRMVRAFSAVGHEAVVLTRRPDVAAGVLPRGVRTVRWDGVSSDLPPDTVEGTGAIVNLAGANIGQGRGTASRKRELLESRTRSTGALVAMLGRMPAERRPKVLVNTSGIDFYGDRGDEVITEESAQGDTFLARVCVEWERVARQAEPLGVRVALMRMALVLGPGARSLRLRVLLFRLFAGGPLGNGRQWFNWIHIDDAIGLYRLAVERETIRGPLNVLAPEVLRERDAAREIGQAVGRPSWIPAPAAMMRLAMGEQADLLLHGRRAEPWRVLAAGHRFQYPTFHEAVAEALGGTGT